MVEFFDINLKFILIVKITINFELLKLCVNAINHCLQNFFNFN